jgi:hypothetical protein
LLFIRFSLSSFLYVYFFHFSLYLFIFATFSCLGAHVTITTRAPVDNLQQFEVISGMEMTDNDVGTKLAQACSGAFFFFFEL